MSGFLTTSLKLRLLQAYFGAAALNAPATLYVGALTTAPDAAGAGAVEPMADDYARVAITNNGVNFVAGTGAEVVNGTDITFEEAAAQWGAIVGLGLYESAVSATPIGYAPSPKQIDELDTLYVAAGGASFQLINAA